MVMIKCNAKLNEILNIGGIDLVIFFYLMKFHCIEKKIFIKINIADINVQVYMAYRYGHLICEMQIANIQILWLYRMFQE